MRVWKTTLLFLAPTLFTAGDSGAQTTAAKSAVKSEFSDEPYVIEHLKNSIRFEADGKGQRELTLRVRVQSESAVREFGLLVYPYMASFESLDVVEVRVRKPDGTEVQTPASEIQEVDSAVSRVAPMYTDEREKHIAVKALSVGDLLEAHLKWDIHDPIAKGHFWYDHNFYKAGICLDEELQFNVPKSVSVKLSGMDSTTISKDDGDRHIYVFHSSHLQKEKEKPKEEEIPDWEKNFHGIAPPAVRLTSFSSWAEVGAWYGELQKSKVEVTPRIQSMSDELTKGKTSEREKIQAIYEFVASRFRYIGIDFGAGRYTPHSAEDVLTNRYGDCKDKHTLFAALLQAAGIRAYPVLVSVGYKIDPALPSASLFNHVITAIPQGGSYLFLDTTPEVAPFGLLLAQERDRQTLVVPAGSPATLVNTPADPPVPNGETFRMDASLDFSGTLDGKVRIEDHGDNEVILRMAYRNTPQNRWTELMQSISKAMGFGGTVSDVAAAQPERTAAPFWLNYSYHRTDYSDWKDHQISLPFPPIFLPDLNAAQKKSKEPLPLGSPQEVNYESSIKLPEGIQPTFPSSGVDRKTDFAEYRSTYTFENGVLRGTRYLIIKAREVPGTERAAYSEFVKALQEDTWRMIALNGDFEANSPVQKSRALLREGKTAEVIELLEKETANGSENPEVELVLGSAYLRVSDEAKAAAQFEKLISDQAAPAILNDVAYEYAKANRRLNEALDYATRAVAGTSAETLKPTLESATPADYMRMKALAAHWDTLGWVNFRLGKTETAQRYVEASWSLWQRAIIGEHLVEVYERLGKKKEADQVCRMALAAPGLSDELDTKEKLLAAQKRIGLTRPDTGFVSTKSYRPPSSAGIDLSEMRATKVPSGVQLLDGTKSAIFAIAIGNGAGPAEAQFVSGDNALQPEAKFLKKGAYQPIFPDEAHVRILRKGLLSCSKYTKDCTFVTFPVDDALIPISTKPY